MSRLVLRTLKVDPDLWAEAQRVAAERGETVSEVIKRGLRLYVMRHAPRR